MSQGLALCFDEWPNGPSSSEAGILIFFDGEPVWEHKVAASAELKDDGHWYTFRGASQTIQGPEGSDCCGQPDISMSCPAGFTMTSGRIDGTCCSETCAAGRATCSCKACDTNSDETWTSWLVCEGPTETRNDVGGLPVTMFADGRWHAVSLSVDAGGRVSLDFDGRYQAFADIAEFALPSPAYLGFTASTGTGASNNHFVRAISMSFGASGWTPPEAAGPAGLLIHSSVPAWGVMRTWETRDELLLVGDAGHTEHTLVVTPDPAAAPPAVPVLPTGDPTWTCLFRQTVPNFKPVDDWLRFSPNDRSGDFSILDELESSRNADGKFTLKLVWPQHGGENTQTWRQTSNPVTQTQSHGGVTGYEPIDIHFTAQGWGGLEKGGSNSLLDGTASHGNWWYAVGSSVVHDGAIPGPGMVATQVELWASEYDAPAVPPPPVLSGPVWFDYDSTGAYTWAAASLFCAQKSFTVHDGVVLPTMALASSQLYFPDGYGQEDGSGGQPYTGGGGAGDMLTGGERWAPVSDQANEWVCTSGNGYGGAWPMGRLHCGTWDCPGWGTSGDGTYGRRLLCAPGPPWAGESDGQTASVSDLALEIVGDDPNFVFDGAAWSLTSSHTYPTGSKLTDAFFNSPVEGVRIEMNGFEHTFMLADADRGMTLSQLTSGTGVTTEPCSSASGNKPFVYKQSQSSGLTGTIAQLWNEVAHCGSADCEDRYMFDGLLFNFGRGTTGYGKIGMLRDEAICACCPASASGVGLRATASGGTDSPGDRVNFLPARVYVINDAPPRVNSGEWTVVLASVVCVPVQEASMSAGGPPCVPEQRPTQRAASSDGVWTSGCTHGNCGGQPASTICGSFGEVVGGYSVLGVGDWVEIAFDLSSAPHTEVSVSLKFLSIDSWDQEWASVSVDCAEIWTQSFSHSTGANVCGAGWGEREAVVSVDVPHTADLLVLRVTTTLDQGATDESWGVSDVAVLPNAVPPPPAVDPDPPGDPPLPTAVSVVFMGFPTDTFTLNCGTCGHGRCELHSSAAHYSANDGKIGAQELDSNREWTVVSTAFRTVAVSGAGETTDASACAAVDMAWCPEMHACIPPARPVCSRGTIASIGDANVIKRNGLPVAKLAAGESWIGAVAPGDVFTGTAAMSGSVQTTPGGSHNRTVAHSMLSSRLAGFLFVLSDLGPRARLFVSCHSKQGACRVALRDPEAGPSSAPVSDADWVASPSDTTVAPGLGAVELPLGTRSGTMQLASDGLIVVAISVSDSELMPVPPASLGYLYGIASPSLMGAANTQFVYADSWPAAGDSGSEPMTRVYGLNGAGCCGQPDISMSCPKGETIVIGSIVGTCCSETCSPGKAHCGCESCDTGNDESWTSFLLCARTGTYDCRFTNGCGANIPEANGYYNLDEVWFDNGVTHIGQVQEQRSDESDAKFQPRDSLRWRVNGYATESRGKASRVRFMHVCSESEIQIVAADGWPTWCKVIKILAFFVWGLHWICWNRGCEQPRWQDESVHKQSSSCL